jgi:F0F1-type ATP synthase assembly protein I
MKSVYLKYSTMAFQMGATIGIFAYAGYRLDRHYMSRIPYFTIILSLIGVSISLYSVIRDFINPQK